MRWATGSRADVAAGAASVEATAAGGAAEAELSAAPVAHEASASMAASALAPAIIPAFLFVLDIGSPLIWADAPISLETGGQRSFPPGKT